MSNIVTLPQLPEGTAVLAPFVAFGVFHEADVQVAGAVSRSIPGVSDEVVLAAALCVRALQLGHVCVELEQVAATIGADDTRRGAELDPQDPASAFVCELEDLRWPDPVAWADALRNSDAVTERDPVSGQALGTTDPAVLRPLVFDGTRVYLERYWRYERQVGDTLLGYAGERDVWQSAIARAMADDATVEAVLDQFFGPEDPIATDLQRRAARTALRRRVTVLAGGPGTGKTHTIARMLAAAHQLAMHAGRPLDVALAAPTGKAAARMTEAVHDAVAEARLPSDLAEPLRATEAGTIHRLLGHRDGITFRHDATNPLPHDLVVIDETSMVALPLMARLLDAVRPDAHLVLVGDPFQLTSVEAGAVLGDVVGPATRTPDPAGGPLAESIVVLRRVHRFADDSAIAVLADAVRAGDTDRALAVLRDTGSSEVNWIRPDDAAGVAAIRGLVMDNATALTAAAREGDVAKALACAAELKVLCGTRWGPAGSFAWRDHIERGLPHGAKNLWTNRRWYVGQPVIITANDYIMRMFNGDTGVVVDVDGQMTVMMRSGAGIRSLLPSQLDSVETWWAMTIHKSQGSEFTHAVVCLPDAGSLILTNELLYTGLTRGRDRVTVLATEDALRAAIERPVARASGLRDRLWPQSLQPRRPDVARPEFGMYQATSGR